MYCGQDAYRNSLGAATPKSMLRTSTCDTTPMSENVNASFVVFAWNYHPLFFCVQCKIFCLSTSDRLCREVFSVKQKDAELNAIWKMIQGKNRVSLPFSLSPFPFLSAAAVTFSTMMSTLQGIDVVGVDSGSHGCHCVNHAVCGHFVKAKDYL
jgi:hypothetical protein